MAASCFDLSTDSVEDFDLASTSAHLSEPSPSSPSSAWSESSRHEEVPVASTGDFAKRPSVGTWLLSKPRVQEEASHASGSGSNMASIQLEALEGEANMLARELAAIARKWHELVEDESRFKIESSQAAIEKERLQERLARLRAVMRRLQGRACEAAPAELPRAATRLGTAGESAKLCKRAKLLHQLPRLLLRAEQFDMDEDGMGDATLEEMEEEVAAIAAFASEAAEELRALEGEVAVLWSVRGRLLEENRQLESRIGHLRTCVASAKRKAAFAPEKAQDDQPKAGLASFRQGGC